MLFDFKLILQFLPFWELILEKIGNFLKLYPGEIILIFDTDPESEVEVVT